MSDLLGDGGDLFIYGGSKTPSGDIGPIAFYGQKVFFDEEGKEQMIGYASQVSPSESEKFLSNLERWCSTNRTGGNFYFQVYNHSNDPYWPSSRLTIPMLSGYERTANDVAAMAISGSLYRSYGSSSFLAARGMIQKWVLESMPSVQCSSIYRLFGQDYGGQECCEVATHALVLAEQTNGNNSLVGCVISHVCESCARAAHGRVGSQSYKWSRVLVTKDHCSSCGRLRGFGCDVFRTVDTSYSGSGSIPTEMYLDDKCEACIREQEKNAISLQAGSRDRENLLREMNDDLNRSVFEKDLLIRDRERVIEDQKKALTAKPSVYQRSALRIGVRQAGLLGRDAIQSGIVSRFEKHAAAITSLMESDFGVPITLLLFGLSMKKIPAWVGIQPSEDLVDEFIVEGMSGVGSELVGIIIGPIREAIKQALSPKCDDPVKETLALEEPAPVMDLSSEEVVDLYLPK